MKMNSLKIFSAFLVAIVLGLVFNSCKKDKQLNEQEPVTVTDGIKTNNNNASQSRISYNLYTASAATLNTALSDFQAQIVAAGNGGKPGLCPLLGIQKSIIKSVDLFGSYCSGGNPTVNVTYRWMLHERIAYVNSLSYTFDVLTDLGTTSHTPISVQLVSDVPFCNGQDPNVNPCNRLKTYDVTVQLTGAQFGGMSTLNRVTTLCTLAGSTPLVYEETVPIAYPNSYYTGNPARANVSGFPGQVIVLTECSILCYPPHTVCPQTGTFRYRLLPNGVWSAPITFNAINGLIQPLPAGNYEYTLTLNYLFGPSLPQTGTFSTL